jgi:hypothetical protein
MPVTQRAEGPVSFSTLSSTARIINISPAWPSVAQALTYLRATPPPAPGPEYDAAVQTVREFAELLRRNAPTIANALLCGALLGELTSTRAPAAALRAGLMIISEAYRFSLRSEADVNGILAKLSRELPPMVGTYSLPRSPLEIGDRAEEWVAVLKTAIGEIQARGGNRPPDLRTSVQPFLMQRVKSFLAGNPVDDPRPEELVAHAARDVDSGFLRWDLARMTAVQWSRVVEAWLQPSSAEERPAPWLVAAALGALGYQMDDSLATAAWLDPADGEVGPVDAASYRRSGPAAERGLLLVRDTTKRTIAERWLPAPTVATLVLPPAAAARLLSRLVLAKEQPPIGPELRFVAIEGIETTAVLQEHLAGSFKGDPFARLLGRVQIAHVLPSEGSGDLFSLLGPIIVRPRGFEDLFERMQARARVRIALK